MARTAFIDKFSTGRARETRDSLAHVTRNVRDMLNTKEGYGYFLRGFGLDSHPRKSKKGGPGDALAEEIEKEIRLHEPRLGDVAVKLTGRDSALCLHFEVRARLEGQPCRLRVMFDTITGHVRLENDEDAS